MIKQQRTAKYRIGQQYNACAHKAQQEYEIIAFHMQSLNLVLLFFFSFSLFHVISVPYTHRTTCKFAKACLSMATHFSNEEPSDVASIQFIANYFADYALLHAFVIIRLFSEQVLILNVLPVFIRYDVICISTLKK